MTLAADLRTLLDGIASESMPLDAVEAWFQRNQDALHDDVSLTLKSVVQGALAQAWAWRTRRLTAAQARAGLLTLIDRLPV